VKERHTYMKRNTHMDFSLVWVMSEKSSREWCARSFTHKTYVSFHINYVSVFIRMIFLFIYIRFLLRRTLSLTKHRSLFQNIGLFSYVLGLFSYVQFLLLSIFGFSWGSCFNTSVYTVVSFHIHWDSCHV